MVGYVEGVRSYYIDMILELLTERSILLISIIIV